MDEPHEPLATASAEHFLGHRIEAEPARDPARRIAEGEGRVTEVEADIAG